MNAYENINASLIINYYIIRFDYLNVFILMVYNFIFLFFFVNGNFVSACFLGICQCHIVKETIHCHLSACFHFFLMVNKFSLIIDFINFL